MKKIIALLATLALTTAAFGEETKETGDIYEVEEIKTSSSTTKREERSRRNAPVELKSSSVFRYNGLETKVEQDDIAIFYYPEFKEIGFTATSTKSLILSFDKLAQGEIKLAFEEYKRMFDNKELLKKKSKTVKAFGKTKCRYVYDTFFKDQKAEPDVKLGYVFVKKSPYFIMTVEESKTTIRNPVDKDRDATTKKMKILFNKNQMETLIDQFDYQPESNSKATDKEPEAQPEEKAETATTDAN